MQKNLEAQESPTCNQAKLKLCHTAGLDTIFVQIYMDALPGVSKNQNFFFTNKTVEFLR